MPLAAARRVPRTPAPRRCPPSKPPPAPRTLTLASVRKVATVVPLRVARPAYQCAVSAAVVRSKGASRVKRAACCSPNSWFTFHAVAGPWAEAAQRRIVGAGGCRKGVWPAEQGRNQRIERQGCLGAASASARCRADATAQPGEVSLHRTGSPALALCFHKHDASCPKHPVHLGPPPVSILVVLKCCISTGPSACAYAATSRNQPSGHQLALKRCLYCSCCLQANRKGCAMSNP